MMLVKEKLDVANLFELNKGRLVARGDLRKRKPKEITDTFSPTSTPQSLLTVLNIVLHRKYAYIVADIDSAYLHAKFRGKVYMRLDPYLTRIMLEIDDSIRDLVQEDGSLYVQITKALYGLQESAKLWYETLQDTLEKEGFQRSNYDHGLFFKKIGKELVIVLVYVDDLFIAGEEGKVAKALEQLKSHFPMKTTEMNPKDFDYVGMKGKYNSEDHSFSLSQPGMIEKITKGVTGVADLPCDSKLYADADTTKLEDVTGFRSKLM